MRLFLIILRIVWINKLKIYIYIFIVRENYWCFLVIYIWFFVFSRFCGFNLSNCEIKMF